MKRHPVLYILILLATFLSACGGSLPFEIDFPADAAARPPTSTPVRTITPAASLLPSLTPSLTPTLTPFPTRRSPYPVGLGTPLPDAGFPGISSGNTTLLKNVFEHIITLRQAAVISSNQEKVLIATSKGLYLFDVQDNQLAHWPEIKMANVVCSACLTVNEDASRFAIALRKDGTWQIQVHSISDEKLELVKTFVGPETFGLESEPVQVAISPDGEVLVYSFGGDSFVLYNLSEEIELFEYRGQVQSLQFSRGGQYIHARRQTEVLIWDVYDIEGGFRNFLLPNENAAIDFSLGGEYVAVAFSSKIRLYQITPLRLVREIDVPPTSVTNRTWQIAFLDDETLRGYALQWDSRTQTGQATIGEWDVSSGEALTIEERETDTQNTFDEFTGVKFVQDPLVGGLDPNGYRALRFISADVLLVNSQYAACSFKLTTGETNCQAQDDSLLHATDGPVFREIREEKNTLLVNALGETIFSLDPYPIRWVNRTADFLLLDINSRTTDLYVKDRSLPVQSVPGSLRSVAENTNLLVFLTKQNNELMYMTMVEKATQKALFQKRETRLYDMLSIALDGTTYFLREDRDSNQAILKAIPPGTDEVLDLLRIDLAAEPISMAISPKNTLAIGMQDGSVTIISLDGLTQEIFQALQNPVSLLAFSPDGRYLAAAGQDGVTVFAALPR
jgi:WD40 repeat protein